MTGGHDARLRRIEQALAAMPKPDLEADYRAVEDLTATRDQFRRVYREEISEYRSELLALLPAFWELRRAGLEVLGYSALAYNPAEELEGNTAVAICLASLHVNEITDPASAVRKDFNRYTVSTVDPWREVFRDLIFGDPDAMPLRKMCWAESHEGGWAFAPAAVEAAQVAEVAVGTWLPLMKSALPADPRYGLDQQHLVERRDDLVAVFERISDRTLLAQRIADIVREECGG